MALNLLMISAEVNAYDQNLIGYRTRASGDNETDSDQLTDVEKGEKYMATLKNKKLTPRDEIFDGIITDISDSGICLLTTNPMIQGQKILINNALQLSQTAIVRWSERFDSRYHRVGLEFLEPE